MSELHEKLKITFATYCNEIEKFETKKTKVSAVRARQALNELKALIVERRREIQEQKGDM